MGEHTTVRCAEPAMPPLNHDPTLNLPDGRRLAYRIYGASAGEPVYFFHGFPGSRLQAALVHDQAQALRIALVAFDRPGFGRSSPARAATVDAIAPDVRALADALGHERLAVLGVSCGGPHALAVARLMPRRVTGVGLLAGIGPMDQPALRAGQLPLLRAMFGLARWQPWLISPLLAMDWLMFRHQPERAVRALASMLTLPDRQCLAQSASLRAAFAASLAEAYRQGLGGAMREAQRIARFTTAQLAGLSMPVHVFQSGHDRNVPPAMGRFMAEAIATATLHDCPDDGHLSIVLTQFERCVRCLQGR